MNVSQETIDKLVAHMAKHGARGTAKTIIDQRLRRKIGLTSDDLADTATFASGLDEIEELLTQGDYGEAFEVAKDTVDAMLEDEGFGDMFENVGHGVSEIHAVIQQLVDRDGIKQAAYSLLNMALEKINNNKGLYWIRKSELKLTESLLASIEQLLNQKRYDEAYIISSSHAKRIKQCFDEADGDISEVRKIVKSVVREQFKKELRESDDKHDYYLIDNQGYYSIPNIDSLLDTLEEKEQLPMFYKMHFVNLAATEAKKEMQDMDMDQYDYPEGIETVIEGGQNFLAALENRISKVYGKGAIEQLRNIIDQHRDNIPMG